MDASEYTIISGKKEQNPIKGLPRLKANRSKAYETEHDSGLCNSSPMPIREEFGYIERSDSPPPGSLPLTDGQFPIVPPVLRHGASVNFIPDTDGARIPSNSGAVNTRAVHPTPTSTTSYEEDCVDIVYNNMGDLTFSHSPYPTTTEGFSLSSSDIKKLNDKIKKLQQDNAELREKVKEEQHVKEDLINQVNKLQKNAEDREKTVRNELVKKEQELQEYQSTISTMEKAHGETCTKLRKEIEDLNKKIDDDKTRTVRQEMTLRTQLSETESELHKAQKTLAEKETEIKQLENEILQAKCKLKDDKIQELTERNRTLEERERQRERRRKCIIL